MTAFRPAPFAAPPRPVFGRAAQHADTPAPLSRRGLARRVRQARLAADLLPELPEPGESVHALMTGRYDLCQVIAATLALKPCRHLRIATLCLSKRNAAELVGLIEAGRCQSLTVLVSDFFKGHNKEEFERFAADLSARPGCRLAAARSHCKVTTFDYDDADGLVFEGSANLRTNKNREHLTATRDRPLHDWHAGWIDAVVSQHGRG